MADIKSHTIINDIKSTRDIKQAQHVIKDNVQKSKAQIKDSNSIENQTEKSVYSSSTLVGTETYTNSKIIQSTVLRGQEKNYKNARKEYNQLKSDIKTANKEYKQNIMNSKKEYKEIKSRASKDANKNIVQNSNVSADVSKDSKIKNARNQYKSTKKTEKIKIKDNKRLLRTNWRKLLKVSLKKKSSSTIFSGVAIIMALIMFIIMFAELLSPIGIFFSNESVTDGMYSLNSAMAAINQEFENEIKKIETNNTYDDKIILNYGCNYQIANWSDIIAVWDVKLNISDESVLEIDENKFQEMRKVAWDMISITSQIQINENSDSNANIREETSKKTLKIIVNYKSVDDMCSKYNFNANQEELVYFLLSSDEYISLFMNSDFSTTVDLGNFDFGEEKVNDKQKNVVLVATNTSKYGITARSGYCQAWVEDVLQQVNGSRGYAASAISAGKSWSVSKDWSKIQVGAAVYGYASNPYGHVGIYIGNGQVIHNLSGCVKIQSLESWVKSFNGVCWGWDNGINLTGNPEYECVGGLI